VLFSLSPSPFAIRIFSFETIAFLYVGVADSFQYSFLPSFLFFSSSSFSFHSQKKRSHRMRSCVRPCLLIDATSNITCTLTSHTHALLLSGFLSASFFGVLMTQQEGHDMAMGC